MRIPTKPQQDRDSGPLAARLIYNRRMKYFTLMCMLLATPGAWAACGNDQGQARQFDAVYTADMLANVKGGEQRRAAYLDNLDLTLSVDADAAYGWSNTCLFGYGLYNNGSHFSDGIVGDAQTVSNIETDVRAARLFEAWVEHSFPRAHASVRAGLYDLNSEFDSVEASQLFINSAHGIGTAFSQSGQNGPSIFPVTSLALRGDVAVTDHWLVRAAVLDAVPGDPAHPGRTTIKLGQGSLRTVETAFSVGRRTAGLGYWSYTDKFDPIVAGAPQKGNDGWYVYGATPFPGAPALEVFARYGVADQRFNQFRAFLGAGVTWRGAVTGSDNDVMGLAIAWAQTGESWRVANNSRANETNIEFTWQLQLSNTVSIQPDVQYIISPGADPSLGNAMVVGVRAVITLYPR